MLNPLSQGYAVEVRYGTHFQIPNYAYLLPETAAGNLPIMTGLPQAGPASTWCVNRNLLKQHGGLTSIRWNGVSPAKE